MKNLGPSPRASIAAEPALPDVSDCPLLIRKSPHFSRTVDDVKDRTRKQRLGTLVLHSDHRHHQEGLMLAAAMDDVPTPIGAGFVAEIDRHFVFRIAVDIGTLNGQPQRFA